MDERDLFVRAAQLETQLNTPAAAAAAAAASGGAAAPTASSAAFPATPLFDSGAGGEGSAASEAAWTAREVARIRTALDTGAPLPLVLPGPVVRPAQPAASTGSCDPFATSGDDGGVSVHSVAEALLLFVESLREPLLPLALFPTTDLDGSALPGWSRRLLEQLPAVSYNCFVYLLAFMRHLLTRSDR